MPLDRIGICQMPLTYRTTRRAVLGLFMGLAAACGPIMRSDKTPGSFAWFDLITDAPAVSRAFYAEMFGWRFSQGRKDNVQVITQSRSLIGGMVTIAGEDVQASEARWQPVLSVADSQVASDRARASGGRQIGQGYQGPSGGLAAFRDPLGAWLTLYDGPEGVPLGQAPEVGTWVWVDLLTTNPRAARAFYQNVAGFETRSEERAGATGYTVFTSQSKDRGGMIKVTRDQASPMWLPYVLVANVEGAIAKATGLGARLVARKEDIAVLIDPSGAAFGIAERNTDS